MLAGEFFELLDEQLRLERKMSERVTASGGGALTDALGGGGGLAALFGEGGIGGALGGGSAGGLGGLASLLGDPKSSGAADGMGGPNGGLDGGLPNGMGGLLGMLGGTGGLGGTAKGGDDGQLEALLKSPLVENLAGGSGASGMLGMIRTLLALRRQVRRIYSALKRYLPLIFILVLAMPWIHAVALPFISQWLKENIGGIFG